MSLNRNLFGLVVPALTIGIFAVFVAFSLMRLSAIDRNMRIEATQNMLWVISRAQVSSHQLQEAVTFRALGQRKQSDVDRSLNTFLGHFSVLNDGPQRRAMELLQLSPALDRITKEQEALTALTTRIGVGETNKVAEVHAILAPYDATLVLAANKAMVGEWESVGRKLDHFRQEISLIILALAVIFVAGLGMTRHLVQATRSARLRARLLERERAFSQLLVRSSSEAIIAVDPDHRCTMWNQAASAMFEVSPEEALCDRLGHAQDFFRSGPIEAAIAGAMQGDLATLVDQTFFRSLDATLSHLDLRCFPLRDGDSIIGAILLISDNTQQHTARHALSERRDYLEGEVKKRTQELNAALSRERAATDVYRNFAAMISHQFRTPLAIADSALQRLVRRANSIEPDELVERGNKARHALARLVCLVESTLGAARLDAGQLEQRTTFRRFGQVAQEALRRQQEDTPDRHFILDETCPGVVQCDPIHTEHIIGNLLSNAAKYAPADTVIRITVGQSEHQAWCTVVNEGHIAPQDRDLLFERYFRTDDVKEKNGAGIGLYMARSLARLQDGDVTFQEVGAGELAFTLSLPLADGLA